MFSGDNIFTLIVAVVCLAVFYVGIRTFIKSFAWQRRQEALASTGVITQAKITRMAVTGVTTEEMHSTTTSRGNPSCFVDYEYSVPGAGSGGQPQRYKRSVKVRSQAYSKMKVGDEVAIVYSRSNPATSQFESGKIEANTPTTDRLWGLAFTVGSLAFGIYMVTRLLRK